MASNDALGHGPALRSAKVVDRRSSATSLVADRLTNGRRPAPSCHCRQSAHLLFEHDPTVPRGNRTSGGRPSRREAANGGILGDRAVPRAFLLNQRSSKMNSFSHVRGAVWLRRRRAVRTARNLRSRTTSRSSRADGVRRVGIGLSGCSLGRSRSSPAAPPSPRADACPRSHRRHLPIPASPPGTLAGCCAGSPRPTPKRS
jgi:hypothetical protein